MRAWFNDGIKNYLREECPKGCKPGRIMPDQSKYKHYTNGTINVFCEECPEGFYPGLTTHKERKKVDKAGKKHFTNGINNIFTYDCPEGYYPGITIHNKRKERLSTKLESLLNIIDPEVFTKEYKTTPSSILAEKYKTSTHMIDVLAEHYKIIRTEDELKDIEEQKKLLQKNRTIKTCLDRYGCKSPKQSDIIKEKLKIKYLEKYGAENISGRSIQILNSDVSDEFKSFILNPSLGKIFFEEHNREFTKTELCERFNCNINSINNFIYKNDLANYLKQDVSHYENELAELFPNINFTRHYRKELSGGKELDLFDPINRIGIEFNGDYWHSTLNISNHKYHQEKSLAAQDCNIRLIHIYEYEWNNPEQKAKILMLLNSALNNNTNKIYARNCTIKEISNQEAKELNNKIHLQGHRPAQVTYGLYYNNELVQLMSFSKTKYNRNIKNDNSWEIIRGCPGSNCNVVGGVSKLFKHFIHDYNPDEIFSYCDFNKFDGKSYEALGMECIGYTEPDMKWILKNGKVVNRNPAKHKELKELSAGQIFGAGSKKYVWRKTI